MKKNKICILWHCPYPWDIRIDKFCRAFMSAGYDVSLVCRGRNGEKKSEKISGISIYRVFPPRWFNNYKFTFPLFFNPIWIASVKKFLIKIEPDLLIVRDIPMAYLAGRMAKKLEVPVIQDMAENYPAALVAYNNKLYAPFLFGNAVIPRFYEKACLKLMSHIIVVSREQREKLGNIGVNKDNISIVMNTPDLKYYNELRIKNRVQYKNSCKKVKKLIYVGYIDAHRGVEVLIRGLAIAARIIPSLSLTIVGSGGEIKRLQRLTEEIGASRYIEFTGWVSFERVPSYIEASDIGVIPHLKNEHTDTTIPNKLFDYMAFAKPVIASDLDAVAEIVNDIGCGKVFKSGEPQDLADKIIWLITSGEIESIGEKGLKAVNNHYNWDNDRSVLISVIRNILRKKARQERQRQ